MSAPVVFLAYNRPHHTKMALESFANNVGAKQTDLHIFIDGPKCDADKEKIAQVKDVVNSAQWSDHVTVYESEKNRKCAGQTIHAITQMCDSKGRVILFEDDNVLSPYFLDFMNKALDLYEDNEKVMDISAYMFPVGDLSVETGFMRGGGGWGWATWARAWKHFEPDGKVLFDKISDKQSRYEFNFRNSFNYYGMLKKQVEGKIDSWSIRWQASMFVKNGLTLFPAKSLLRNTGFDDSGTNTTATKRYDTDLWDQPVKAFPEDIKETDQMLRATIKYYRKISNPFIKVCELIKAKLIC